LHYHQNQTPSPTTTQSILGGLTPKDLEARPSNVPKTIFRGNLEALPPNFLQNTVQNIQKSNTPTLKKIQSWGV